jgi:hypothetical protein
MKDRTLTRLVRDMRDKHGCHTVILYGSRARGDASATSDYDLIGFRKSGAVRHDARALGRAFLDAFIYPEKDTKAAELLHLRDGVVLFQTKNFGDKLLARIARVHAKGPKPLTAEEKRVRIVWARKMLARARWQDTEGNFRRAWLLTALLEDYFALRGLWYEGPKMAFGWLKQHAPKIARLYGSALKPGAKLSAISKLVTAVTRV